MADLIITPTATGVDLTDSAGGDVTIDGAAPGAGGGLGPAEAASPGIPTSLVRKIEVFDSGGTSLGFIPVYANL